ncbi:MAG: hypothetical protein E7573_02795 [Ruminococcaceae bacterium]|nr:hypothetical protein [Oscillospiraceae bacterium]MBR3596817.1 hypothetical protein [Clostridia bacterium]
MDAVKDWGMMLIFVSAGCMIYYFLLPSGNVSKTVKGVVAVTVMSLIFMPLFSVLSSLSQLKINFSSPPSVVSPEDVIIDSARERVNGIIDETVKEFSDISYKSEIFIDIEDDRSIHIRQVELTFPSLPSEIREIKEALYEKLSIMPVIKVEKTDE